jgi:t-SNARE complex subunit (syntaxin)
LEAVERPAKPLQSTDRNIQQSRTVWVSFAAQQHNARQTSKNKDAIVGVIITIVIVVVVVVVTAITSWRLLAT